MILKIIEFFRARMKMTIYGSYVVLGLLVIYDFLFVDKQSAHTKPELWFGFWSVFGFVACVLIIFVSKWYGHLGIMTREDYYDD